MLEGKQTQLSCGQVQTGGMVWHEAQCAWDAGRKRSWKPPCGPSRAMLPADHCSNSSLHPVFHPRNSRTFAELLNDLNLLMPTQKKLCWQCRFRHVAQGHPMRHRELKQGSHPQWHGPSIAIPPASRGLGSGWQSPTRLRCSPLNWVQQDY